MKRILKKYRKKLAILKENRASTVDENTDLDNELYDQLIKQVAEFIRDLNQLNILHVSKQRELLIAFFESIDNGDIEKQKQDKGWEVVDNYLKAIYSC